MRSPEQDERLSAAAGALLGLGCLVCMGMGFLLAEAAAGVQHLGLWLIGVTPAEAAAQAKGVADA